MAKTHELGKPACDKCGACIVAKAAPFIDAPFVFNDIAHINKVVAADLLKPIADEIAQKAELVVKSGRMAGSKM